MNEEVSLGALIEAYERIRPREVATLRSILARFAQELVSPKTPRARSPTGAAAVPGWEAFPAHRLYGLLAPDGRNWRADVAARMPPGHSYQKAYVRFVRRLIAFGEARGLIQPDHYLISPAWRALMPRLEAAMPDDLSPVQRSALRCALRKLARWATDRAAAPSAIPPTNGEGFVMAEFKATFRPDRDGDFYRARKAWNMLVAASPDHDLTPWPSEAASAFAALPVDRWPPILQRGLDQLLGQEGLGTWSRDTRAGYVQRLGSYLGTLDRAGVDVAGLIEGALTSEDAFRLLFQGMPAGSGVGDVHSLVALAADSAGGLLPTLREQAGRFEGRANEPNPLVLLVVSAMAEAGFITSARDLLHKVRAINHGLLGITPRHTAWCARRIGMLDERARRMPSAYARKKRAVFRSPELWPALVRVRDVIQRDVARAEGDYRAAAGTCAVILKRRWAVALRNAIIFGLLLCYPIRTRNLVEMRIGEHYDPSSHLMFFPREETKNGKEIEYELPEGGPFGDLRGLVDQYIKEGRPALLAGRPSSYMFVPDPRGGVRMRTRAVNAILIELSRRYLSEVLPAGISALNPHLARHTVATYVVGVRRDVNLAAQLLNDSPATITLAYADVLENKKEATKRFLSDFTLPGA